MSDYEINVFTPEEWQQQMFAEVKVAYRLIETVGSADVDAVPYDPDFTARVDAEYDHWLAEVERAAAEKAWSKGHAAGRDYQGDGWNSDAHDPEEDNPYRAAALGLTAEQEGENGE